MADDTDRYVENLNRRETEKMLENTPAEVPAAVEEYLQQASPLELRGLSRAAEKRVREVECTSMLAGVSYCLLRSGHEGSHQAYANMTPPGSSRSHHGTVRWDA